MRNGSKRNQIYLTSENSDVRFGYCFKVKKNLEKCKPNRDGEHLWASMMVLNLFNIIITRPAKFLPLEIFASCPLLMRIYLLGQGKFPMHRMRGSPKVTHCRHRKTR